jgi:hypothetical protein
MILKQPIQNVFVQLTESIHQLSDAEYTKQCPELLHATIGQHVRHIIELFQCLEQGYHKGKVNYEKRKRDYRIETDKKLACEMLKVIYADIGKSNKTLILEADDYEDNDEPVCIPSNYYRELAYNLEHTIHHMALIRVGINSVSSIQLPDQFGVAYSTIKYRSNVHSNIYSG